MGRLKLSNIFKRKPIMCFFCDVELSPGSEFTLQYKSVEGLHTKKMCEACSKIFDELSDLKEEAYNGRD